MNILFCWLMQVAFSNTTQQLTLHFNDGVLSPATLTARSDSPIDLLIINDGLTAEEFDSHELSREKVVAPGSSAVVHLRVLAAGEYAFQGERHSATMQGKLVVK